MTQQETIYYCHPIFRPPSEAYSLLIQATEGCSFRCTFCVSNLRKKFVIRDTKDIIRDLNIARKLYGPNIRKIFFLDGNAMIIPTKKLLAITRYAFEVFPKLERCGVYAHAKDILKKTDSQLRELNEAGLKIAYIGFETGSDMLLKMVHKHATKEELINASKKLMKSGITLSATLILGIGGDDKNLSKLSAEESADLVNRICPDNSKLWYIACLTLMVPPGTELFYRKKKSQFQEMKSLDILKELYLFIENINFENNSKANCVFRTNHASNYLPIGGILDRDKFKILDTIKKGIQNPEMLRPDIYRAL